MNRASRNLPEGRVRSILIILAVGCISVLFYARLFGPYIFGLINVTDDFGTFHLPNLIFIADMLKRGQCLYWNPRFYTGLNILGEGQLALLHPLRMSLYAHVDTHLAFMIDTIAPLLIFQSGTCIFLRSIGASRSASVTSSFLVTFSSSFYARWFHSNGLYALSQMPWILFVCDRYLKASSRLTKSLCLTAIPLIKASQLLFGHPPAMLYGGILEVSFLSTAFIDKRYRKPVVLLTMSYAIGFLLGMPQLIAQYAEAANSVRNPSGRSAFSDTFSFTKYTFLTQLFQPINPFIAFDDKRVHYHEYFVCSGGSSLLVAIYGVSILKLRGRTIAWCVVMFLAAMTLCYLTFVPPLHQAYRALPIIGSFRINQRYGFIAIFSLVIVYAMTIDAMLQGEARRPSETERRKLRLLTRGYVGLSAVVPLLFLVIRSLLPILPIDSGLRIAELVGRCPSTLWQFLGTAFAAGCAAILLSQASNSRKAMSVIGLSVAEVLVLYSSYPYPIFLDAKMVFSNTRADAGESGSEYRVAFAFQPNEAEDYLGTHVMNPIVGSLALNGYASLAPSNFEYVLKMKEMRLASVDRIVFSEIKPVFFHESTNNLYAYDYGSAAWRISETPPVRVQNPFPRFRLVRKSIVKPYDKSDLDSIDLSTTVILEGGEAIDSKSIGSFEILRNSNCEKILRVEGAEGQYLVISDSWHPLWKAFVDGRPTPIAKAYGRYQAIAVAPGVHEVRLVFESEELRLGQYFAWSGTAALVLLIVYQLRPGPLSP